MDLAIIITYINTPIFGNEIWRYLVFIAALVLVYPASKIINYILNNILHKWAKKTSFQFDDILVKSLNPSINMFVLAGMFFIGKSYINQSIIEPLMTKIFNFLLIIPLVFFLIKFTTEIVGFYLKGKKEKGQKINEAAIDLLMSIIRIALFLIGILLVLANIGYDVTALLAGLGVGGLAFALAAQDILKNFFAGVALIFDKTFKKGERVMFQGKSGRIEELKLRSTKLRTYDGTLLTIPNAMLADNIVENVTKVPKVKVAQTFGVTYDTSVEKLKLAKEIIKDAILSEEFTDKKEFWIWFDNYGPYSLDIQVIYFGTMSMDDWPERAYFKDRINMRIKEDFERANINFAFPTQTIEMKTSEPVIPMHINANKNKNIN